MLDIDTQTQVDALYKLIEIKGGKRIDKFQSEDINQVLKYQKWYAKRYREGLLLEILPQKTVSGKQR